MTSQPKPGEVLNGESVRLLLPGDHLQAIAKDAAERVHKNGGCVPQLAFAPILWALQDATSCEGGKHADLIARAKAWSCDPYEKQIINELVAALEATR